MKGNEEQPIFTSRSAAKRYLAEALPLQDAMIVQIVPPQGDTSSVETLSLIWLDMSKRPALRDLARVHTTEGEGESIFTWVYLEEDRPQSCHFILNVDMKSPVRETLRIPFRMQEWAPLIEVIASTGTLSILAGPPVAWRILIKTMETADLIQMIYKQARGDVTFQLSPETMTELRRHYDAWVGRPTPQKASVASAPATPIAVLESLIFWDTEHGACQKCHRPDQHLSRLEYYLPADLHKLLVYSSGEEEKYQGIAQVSKVALAQVRDQFLAPRSQLVCGSCLKEAFAGFTKKDAYEAARRGIEHEMNQHTSAWSALFYCLKVGGTTRQEMIYQSRYTHIAVSGFDEQPSLHDLLDIGNDAARKHFP